MFRQPLWTLILALVIASGCGPTSTPSPTVIPTVATATPSPPPTPTPPPTSTPEAEDTGWVALAPGVEGRRLWADTGAGRERLTLLRFEPTYIRLRVVYAPQHPRRLSEWAQLMPTALAVVNAGYFTPEMRATGLVISDGVLHGRSYDDFAGMLAVDSAGQISLRWLRLTPYRPDEPLVQAVQSFPVLVKPGGVMGFPADADEGQRARRTVVAQDIHGRLLLLVSPAPRFSLHELAVWLTTSDLEIDIAMNLDGGTSTGLWVRGWDVVIDSYVSLPAVIVIEHRGDRSQLTPQNYIP